MRCSSDWGSTGLAYRNRDLVSAADAATLQSFADPKFQGRISLPDNVDDAYALGYLANGINARFGTRAQMLILKKLRLST